MQNRKIDKRPAHLEGHHHYAYLKMHIARSVPQPCMDSVPDASFKDIASSLSTDCNLLTNSSALFASAGSWQDNVGYLSGTD